MLAPWQHQFLPSQRNWVHQPGKAAVALQEENTPRQMACPSPQLQSDMCQQPAHLAEVRACCLCLCLCCLCTSCKLRNKTPGSHRAARSHSGPWHEQNHLHFGKILSAYFLSQRLHIQVSQMFHCFTNLFSFLPSGKQLSGWCWDGAGYLHTLMGNHRGEAFPTGGECCLWLHSHGRKAGGECSRSAAQKWSTEVSPNTEQALFIPWGCFLCWTESSQCTAQSVETPFWMGAKDAFYFCFLFPFSLSWMPWV